ncbi:ribosome small subunit-dependent GTPase A [Flavilitoribacter nigricans]|uniref:Small ribosomal subunit biogenesis GTPase RsgA n=1 Tax=Flavilitoribacter nigricans (strain ATCC 23147 / DSM 23189 / NBRC 102662 / NCIMB 1420 / SS-2) TaxID=1122177 RepID=A0A2D0MXV6_FLAN2|nr:ribosome small subunit-dependent GTPase A [Flavilitoribacter nigricans]PHN01094.1 ribosome small subunit-dependent GTPase A [Flavilitoribacter nigricans DSM 23189 = NBRC 102662]
MTLEDLGYNDRLKAYYRERQLDGYSIGRIVSEHKERYTVKTTDGEFQSELIGNLRFTAESRYDFPAVGDWVAISEYDEDKALIHAIFPRSSIIERQAAGRSAQVQIIATNIDYGLIVQAVDRDFNPNRLERYLTICHASGVEPIVVLTKIDLIEETALAELLTGLSRRINDIPVIPVSNTEGTGLAELAPYIQAGKTYCLLGSSGVGKSTLLNRLAGTDLMKTGDISDAVSKGKHTTTHRELILLERGGILIDNPGMREVGITDAAGGLEMTFDQIMELADACRFKNCTHQHEQGCAVLEALETGELEEAAYENFQKMQRERARFEASKAEQRRKDKSLGKLYKRIQEERRRNKF